MTAQETKLFNAFETTLTATAGASDLTFTVNSVTDSYGSTLAANVYLVLNPDSSTNREVIEVTSVNSGTKTLTCSAIGKRYLAGSAATSGLSHASGSVVRMSPLQQHIEDLNDRVDTIINEAGTAVNTSLFLDEDDMSTDSATKGVTQQSVKAYVDAQVTAQDLDLISDSGTIDIDLDSESLTVSGGEGIDTSATGTTLTIAGEDASTSNKGVASFSSDNFSVSSGDVTIKAGGVDLTAEVTGTLPVANGGTNISSFTAGDLLYASGTTALSKLAKGSAGQILAMNSGATAPEWIANDVGDITEVVAGTGLSGGGSSGSVTLNVASLAVAQGGTGATAFDDKAVIITQDTGTDTLAAAVMDANGELLIGGTSGPAVATLTAGSNVTITNSDGGISIAATDTNTTYSAGTLLDLATTTFNVDLSEAAEAAIADGDYVMFLDGGATGTAAKEAIGDIATLFSGDGLQASSSVMSLDLKSNGGLVIESNEAAVDLGASSITGTLDETDGGTGLTGYTAGDILYASGTDTLAKLAKGSADEVLTMNAGATAPEWAAATTGDITGVTAGTGLSGGGTSGSVTLNVETSQNITALTGGDLTIYEDANNADVSVKMGTSAAESLTIEVLNGGSNKTAEQINFTTATASATANHGKMVFNVDETEIATVDDDGINLASGKTFRVNGSEVGGVTASSTTTFTNKTIDADGTGNSISNIDIGNMTSAVVVTESDTIAGNDNDTTLPTSAAVKGYVDAQGYADIGLIIALG